MCTTFLYLAVRGGLEPAKSAAKSLSSKTEFHMFLLGGEGTLQNDLITLRKIHTQMTAVSVTDSNILYKQSTFTV